MIITSKHYETKQGKSEVWFLPKQIYNLLVCDTGDTTMNKVDNLPVLQILIFHWGYLVYEQQSALRLQQ